MICVVYWVHPEKNRGKLGPLVVSTVETCRLKRHRPESFVKFHHRNHDENFVNVRQSDYVTVHRCWRYVRLTSDTVVFEQ